MKFFLTISLLFMVLLSCSQNRTQADFETMLEGMYKKTVPLIHAEEVVKESPGEFIILDTREIEEYNTSHIDGAIWVGYDELQNQVIENIDKDKPVLVYCSVGYRSERIGEKLQKMGFTNVKNLYGGIFDWKNQDHKVVDKSGEKTEKVHTYNRAWSKWLFKGEKIY